MKLENYPIVKVLLPYVVGIMVAYFGDFSDEVCRIVAYVTGILFVASIWSESYEYSLSIFNFNSLTDIKFDSISISNSACFKFFKINFISIFFVYLNL